MARKLNIHGVPVQQWADIHPDYKSIVDGVRYVLVMDEQGATVSMPLKEAKRRNLV